MQHNCTCFSAPAGRTASSSRHYRTSSCARSSIYLSLSRSLVRWFAGSFAGAHSASTRCNRLRLAAIERACLNRTVSYIFSFTCVARAVCTYVRSIAFPPYTSYRLPFENIGIRIHFSSDLSIYRRIILQPVKLAHRNSLSALSHFFEHENRSRKKTEKARERERWGGSVTKKRVRNEGKGKRAGRPSPPSPSPSP